MRFAILASLVIMPGACNIGTLGDGQTYQDNSPGMVTIRLELPATRSFCDQVQACGGGITHVTFSDTAGQPFQIVTGLCATQCSFQCAPMRCPPILCPAGGGQSVTQVEQTWDGSYYQGSTCGQDVSCFNRRFVLPGRYKARLCATPGVLAASDVGPSTCTAAGPEECVDVPFDLPGPSPIDVQLPQLVGG